MKTKEELSALKEEVETLNNKLRALTDDELAQVTGGDLKFIFLGHSARRQLGEELKGRIIGRQGRN